MGVIIPQISKNLTCNNCPFGICRFSRPDWAGNSHGYGCNIEFWKIGKYETTNSAPYDRDIEPMNCPMKTTEELIQRIEQTGAEYQECGDQAKADALLECINIINSYCKE